MVKNFFKSVFLSFIIINLIISQLFFLLYCVRANIFDGLFESLFYNESFFDEVNVRCSATTNFFVSFFGDFFLRNTLGTFLSLFEWILGFSFFSMVHYLLSPFLAVDLVLTNYFIVFFSFLKDFLYINFNGNVLSSKFYHVGFNRSVLVANINIDYIFLINLLKLGFYWYLIKVCFLLNSLFLRGKLKINLTPNLFVYYPTSSAIVSVFIRFMGVLSFFFLVFIFIFFNFKISYILLFDFFVITFCWSFLNHVFYALEHNIGFKEREFNRYWFVDLCFYNFIGLLFFFLSTIYQVGRYFNREIEFIFTYKTIRVIYTTLTPKNYQSY